MWYGNVYLLKCEQYYKIGIAKDVDKRIRQMQGGNPFELKLVHAFRSRDPHGDEALLHAYFRGGRIRGEWFRLDVRDVERISSITSGASVKSTISIDWQLEEEY